MVEYVKLEDIASITSGGTPSRNNKSYWENGTIPWVKISDINQKYVRTTEEKITEDGLNNSSAKIFPKGTILFTIFATVGDVGILDIDAATNQAIAGIQFNNKIDRDYAYYFLTSLKSSVERKSRGVAQLNINQSILKKIQVPLLSLLEQKHIAKVLDTLTSIIEKRKQQIALLEEAEKSLFVEMFGDPVTNPMRWKVINLSEIGDFKNGMNFHLNEVGMEIHCLNVGDFRNKVNITDTSALQKVTLNETPSSEYLLQNGDIVFVRSNGNKNLVGRCVAVYPNNIMTTFSGFCIRFRKSAENVITQFLLYLLKSESIRKKLQGRGANIQNLNQQMLNRLEIPLPPLSLQKEFTSRIASIEKHRNKMQENLSQMIELKSALMQEYFG